MKLFRKFRALLPLILTAGIFTSCRGQKAFGGQYLKLMKSIPLAGVGGRIDHMDMDIRNQVAFVCALGNNTLEIVDLQKGKVIHTITGLSEPQGVAYIPEHHEIFVANGGNGECYFYDAANFNKTATLRLSSDADDVRYDAVDQKIYVGYGEGGIAVIDAATHRQTGNISLPVHPESFQINRTEKKIFVNLPDANLTGVADITQLKLVQRWHRDVPMANFPMALDEQDHRLFIGYRLPARLAVVNSETGKMIGLLKMTPDADDLYFDPANKRIYVSGGGGYIDIFRQQDDDSYREIANIPTRSGARTSLFVPPLQLFLLAERAGGGKEAQLLVYKAAN